MWVTLLFLPLTPLTAAIGFFAFRAMDVLKPYPARQLEHLHGGWGIMADDLMAGVYANLLVRIALDGRARRMKAAIIAVGSELLDPLRRETNGAYLTARLREIGVEVFARTCVADDGAWLEAAFREALSRAELVISTGGLGPTEDDLTRDAAARAVGRPLRRDEGILEWLRARFARSTA